MFFAQFFKFHHNVNVQQKKKSNREEEMQPKMEGDQIEGEIKYFSLGTNKKEGKVSSKKVAKESPLGVKEEEKKSPRKRDMEGEEKKKESQKRANGELEARGKSLDFWRKHFGDPVESLKKHFNEEAKKHGRSAWIFEASKQYPSTPFQLLDPKKEPKLEKSEYIVPKAIYEERERVEEMLSHRPKLAHLWKNCYPYTLEHTTVNLSDGLVFIKTGDLPPMWLRDSCGQVQHYLPLSATEKDVQSLLESVIQRHTRQILYHPYASAFGWIFVLVHFLLL